PELRALRQLKRTHPGFAYVFMSERGSPLSDRTIRHMILRAGEKAGLPFPVHPHMLRHTCGFYLANKGIDTRAIQQYLGHRNIQYTVRYTELAPHRFLDFPIGGFSPPEGRLARGFKPPAFSRFLFQSAVKSAESFCTHQLSAGGRVVCPGVHAGTVRSAGLWPEEICSDFGDRFLLICLSTPNMPGIWCHASWWCGLAVADICINRVTQWFATAFRTH